jgi:hypothetical protein
MAVSRNKHILYGEKQGHEFMSPVGGLSEDVSHHDFETNHQDSEQGKPDHQFADKDVGLLNGCHPFF